MKDLIVGKEAANRSVEALRLIANAVGSTLGPAGCPALIDKFESSVRETQTSTTKDGVTLLRHLNFIDSVQHAIHSLCVQAALNSVKAAGDGTTSTIVLASSIANAIMQQKSNTPQSYGRFIKKEIEKCSQAVDDFLLDPEEHKNLEYLVAKTSANGDDEIASVASDVVHTLSKYANVIIARDSGNKERYKVVKTDGYVGGSGYHRFRKLYMTFEPRANDMLIPVKLENTAICLVNGNLTKFESIEKTLQTIDSLGKYKYVIFVAFSIDSTFIEQCVEWNREDYMLKIALSEPLLSSGVEGHGFQVMEDVASFTGGKIYDPTHEFKPEFIGECREVNVTGYQTTFLGRSENNRIIQRCKENSEALEYAYSPYQRDVIAARNAELAEGLIKIVVGGGQNADISERADRLDDAVRSAQSVKSGAVAGGGLIYSRIARKVLTDSVLIEALDGILLQNLTNYGVEYDPFKEEEFNDKNYAFSLSSSSYGFETVKESEVVDSADAVRSVLKQATDLAILVSTTRCCSLDSMLKERSNLSLMQSIVQGDQ